MVNRVKDPNSPLSHHQVYVARAPMKKRGDTCAEGEATEAKGGVTGTSEAEQVARRSQERVYVRKSHHGQLGTNGGEPAGGTNNG